MHINHKLKIPSCKSLFSLTSLWSEKWFKRSKIFKRRKTSDLFEKHESHIYLSSSSFVPRNPSSIELERLVNTESSLQFYRTCKYETLWDAANYLALQNMAYKNNLIKSCKNKACSCKPKVVREIEDEKIKKENGIESKYRAYEKIQALPVETKLVLRQQQCGQCGCNKENKKSNKVKFPNNESKGCCACQTGDAETGSKKGKSSVGTDKQDAKSKQASPGKAERKEKPPKKKPPKKEKRICVPHDFEKMINETYEKVTFPECKGKQNCCCQTREVNDENLKKVLASSQICVQKKECVKPVKGPDALTNSNTSTKYSKKKASKKQRCACLPLETEVSEASVSGKKMPASPPRKRKTKKKCCGCFRKKSIRTCQDISVTCRVDRLDQICQNSECKVNSRSVCPSLKNVKSIWLCSTCGKVYSKSCKKCNKTSTKQFDDPKLDSANVETGDLKKIIQAETQHNDKQLNQILKELAEQKNEIKRLSNMFQTIVKNVGNLSGLDSKKVFSSEENLKTRAFCICNGCAQNFYRNGGDIKYNNREQHYPNYFDEINCFRHPDNFDEMNCFQRHDNNKHIKNLINSSKCMINAEKRMNLGGMGYYEMYKNGRHSESGMRACTDTISRDNINLRNVYSILTLFEEDYAIGKVSDPTLIGDETTYREHTYSKVGSLEGFSDRSSNLKGFISWCRKSITSFKHRSQQTVSWKKYKRDRKPNTMINIINNCTHYFSKKKDNHL